MESPKLTEEESKKLHTLFQQLDLNKDGTIDLNDLTSAMDAMQVPRPPGHAQVGPGLPVCFPRKRSPKNAAPIVICTFRALVHIMVFCVLLIILHYN